MSLLIFNGKQNKVEHYFPSKAWSKDGNFDILEITIFPYFCEQLPVIKHLLQTSSSTFNYNIKFTFDNLLASVR